MSQSLNLRQRIAPGRGQSQGAQREAIADVDFRSGLRLQERRTLLPVVASSSPVCHPFEPGVCPIRQKSAFLPVHPDNRRISPHIEVRRR